MVKKCYTNLIWCGEEIRQANVKICLQCLTHTWIAFMDMKRTCLFIDADDLQFARVYWFWGGK